MQKVNIIRSTILICVIAITLPLAFQAGQHTVAGHGAVTASTGEKFLIFNLLSGQEVRGSVVLDKDRGGTIDFRTYYAVFDPNGNAIETSPRYEYTASWNFSFTAITNGQYYLSISIPGQMWTHPVDYKYAISPQRILGMEPWILLFLTLLIGVILEIAASWKNMRSLKKSGRLIS